MKCCICGNECENEYGNNPWPLVDGSIDGVTQSCCNVCNEARVVPARRLHRRYWHEAATKEESEIIIREIRRIFFG